MSYDWTRYNALFTTSTSISPGGVGYGYTVGLAAYPAVPNRQTTTGWVYHLSANYELPLQIGIGANFQIQSGANYARLISVELPNAGSTEFWAADLNTNRTPTVPLLNLRLDKAFNIPGGHRFTAMLDLYNILNDNTVTNFSILNGAKYNTVTNFISPRTLELGLRFEF